MVAVPPADVEEEVGIDRGRLLGFDAIQGAAAALGADVVEGGDHQLDEVCTAEVSGASFLAFHRTRI